MSVLEDELRREIVTILEERAFVAGKIGIALGLARGGLLDGRIAAALEEALAICAPKPMD